MPKVTSYTPAWLSKPNPGHEIFVPSVLGADHPSLSSGANVKGPTNPGPRRTIAQRGTEVFIAVGKEIRWADLVYLKEAWEDKQKSSGKGKSRDSQYQDDHAQGYRVCCCSRSFNTAEANSSRLSKPPWRAKYDSL
jgi:nucleoporin NUP82